MPQDITMIIEFKYTCSTCKCINILKNYFDTIYICWKSTI